MIDNLLFLFFIKNLLDVCYGRYINVIYFNGFCLLFFFLIFNRSCWFDVYFFASISEVIDFNN